jgi:hypothetical protein
MADASTQPKPSSSVKLVLLGEAAVGKVHILGVRATHHLLIVSVVITRYAIRQQRLPREQGAHYRRYALGRNSGGSLALKTTLTTRD